MWGVGLRVSYDGWVRLMVPSNTKPVDKGHQELKYFGHILPHLSACLHEGHIASYALC